MNAQPSEGQPKKICDQGEGYLANTEVASMNTPAAEQRIATDETPNDYDLYRSDLRPARPRVLTLGQLGVLLQRSSTRRLPEVLEDYPLEPVRIRPRPHPSLDAEPTFQEAVNSTVMLGDVLGWDVLERYAADVAESDRRQDEHTFKDRMYLDSMHGYGTSENAD